METWKHHCEDKDPSIWSSCFLSRHPPCKTVLVLMDGISATKTPCLNRLSRFQNKCMHLLDQVDVSYFGTWSASMTCLQEFAPLNIHPLRRIQSFKIGTLYHEGLLQQALTHTVSLAVKRQSGNLVPASLWPMKSSVSGDIKGPWFVGLDLLLIAQMLHVMTYPRPHRTKQHVVEHRKKHSLPTTIRNKSCLLI